MLKKVKYSSFTTYYYFKFDWPDLNTQQASYGPWAVDCPSLVKKLAGNQATGAGQSLHSHVGVGRGVKDLYNPDHLFLLRCTCHQLDYLPRPVIDTGIHLYWWWF